MSVAERYGLEREQVAYIGDDLNDKKCMVTVRENDGITACPLDACEEIRNIADFICTRKSGDGAVRELIDWI